MLIESLKLRDYRNYRDLTITPHPGVNILFGQNGSGKTNLLEAIHYCALGRSHRTSQDREVVRKGAEMSAVGVQLRKNDIRMDVVVKLAPFEGKKKHIFIDKKKASRISDLMGRVQCVIFSPEDLMIVKEGPSVRRRFLDMMISQISTAYFVALQQYQKALEQRNAMLKDCKRGGRCDMGMLEAFEYGMAAPCDIIVPMRRKYVQMLAEIAEEKYNAISGREGERFSMAYDCCVEQEEQVSEQVVEMLRKTRQDDMMRGTTSFGVHREDIILQLSGRDMKVFASQGQIRTAALSMKLSQLEIFRKESGEAPILLLDDVMSELDMTRRTRLLEEIDGVQTFITCTDESDLEGCLDKRSYRVHMDSEGFASIAETSAGEQVNSLMDDEELDF